MPAPERSTTTLPQSSNGTTRVGWLLLLGAWVIIAVLGIVDTVATRDYVALLDDSGTLPADSLPLQRIAPADYADAQTWVRLGLAADQGVPWRTRWTDIDNAPTGRPVYWNSSLIHLVAAAGRVQHRLTGEPIARATEDSLAWINLPLFLVVVMLFSGWAASRTGIAGGVMVAFAMSGYRWFYLGFAPNYFDHHGLLAASTFGLVLGATFMGAGWRAENRDDRSLLTSSTASAGRAAALSALWGAFGMWISAASVVPTIAIIGLAGAVTAWAFGPRAKAHGAAFDASLWRSWGRIGCVAALVAYAAEFAPNHLSMRLEVNHPLYAIAWLGGAELVALFGEWRVYDQRPPAWRAALAALAALSPLAVILLGGPRVFIPIDPAVARMHRAIGEFQSLPSYIRTAGPASAWRFASGVALLLPALLAIRKKQRDRLLVAFTAVVAVASVAMACWQVRWWLTASGAQLCLLLTASASSFDWRRPRTRWLVAVPLSAAFATQAWARAHLTREHVEARIVSQADAMQPLYRDAAIALRASDSGGRITLLSTPTASMAIGYFGRFRTIASFYWENMAGVEAAAEILSSATDEQARALIQARGITHIVMSSTDNFLPELFELASSGSRAKELKQTFGYRLLDLHNTPSWLRPIPFHPRFPDAGDNRANLYQVVPDQTELDAAWNIAIAELAAGRAEDAAFEFERAVKVESSSRRAELYGSAGRIAYQWRAHRLAVALLDSAMAGHPSREVAANIAWIRATSADPGVRDGRLALAMAERLSAEDPNDLTTLDVLGAALAENGRFADAIIAAERMHTIAHGRSDSATEERAVERIRAYSAGRPWRQ